MDILLYILHLFQRIRTMWTFLLYNELKRFKGYWKIMKSHFPLTDKLKLLELDEDRSLFSTIFQYHLKSIKQHRSLIVSGFVESRLFLVVLPMSILKFRPGGPMVF